MLYVFLFFCLKMSINFYMFYFHEYQLVLSPAWLGKWEERTIVSINQLTVQCGLNVQQEAENAIAERRLRELFLFLASPETAYLDLFSLVQYQKP